MEQYATGDRRLFSRAGASLPRLGVATLIIICNWGGQEFLAVAPFDIIQIFRNSAAETGGVLLSFKDRHRVSDFCTPDREAQAPPALYPNIPASSALWVRHGQYFGCKSTRLFSALRGWRPQAGGTHSVLEREAERGIHHLGLNDEHAHFSSTINTAPFPCWCFFSSSSASYPPWRCNMLQ